jgi:aromatic ring-opening dioxygenase LigB subunit
MNFIEISSNRQNQKRFKEKSSLFMANFIGHRLLINPKGETLGVVFACIAPHGAETIPELAGDMFEAFAETRKGMEQLARLMSEQEPETIVIATPHNLRVEATIGVVTSEFSEGTLEANNKQVRLQCECDRQLAKEILANAKGLGLPVVGANYGTSEGPASCMPMDWGTLIPLWFFVGQKASKPKIVIVTPSREIPLQALVLFGQVIAKTAEASKRKVAFVASADQGHAHKADGPYGFHPSSKSFDEMAQHTVLENDLDPLLSLPPQFIEDAKPDSVWQVAILQGIVECVPMKGQLLSYQVPTYFGMLCAAYQLV